MRQVVSVLAWAALLSIVSIPISGEAQTKSDDFPLEGVEERRTLTVESTYLFSTQAYRALTDFVEPKRVDTPEATLFFHFDAMRRGDYESFLKTWTSESVAEMNERNRIQQRDRAFWLEKWAKDPSAIYFLQLASQFFWSYSVRMRRVWRDGVIPIAVKCIGG
jgi:hypothetical protein